MADESLKETAKHLLNGVIWLSRYFNLRNRQGLIGEDYVKLLDPSSTWIDKRAAIDDGTLIFPNVTIRGAAVIGKNCVLDVNSVVEWSTLKNNIYIGPFAHIKRTSIGNNSRLPHRCYIADAEIGKDVNIGSCVDTGNFDGMDKNKTIIKDGAFVGIQVKFIALLCR